MTVASARTVLAFSVLLSLSFAGCGDAGVCIDPPLPEELPNLTAAPRFLLNTTASQESGSGQAILDRPEPVEAEIAVNAATRQISIGLRDPSSGEQLWSKVIDTPGDETIRMWFSPEMYYYLSGFPGVYHMNIALYGAENSLPIVRFEPNPDVSGPYERTVTTTVGAEREISQVDRTCMDFGTTSGVGSGTLLVRAPGACEECVALTCEAIGCDDGDPCTRNDCDLVREECINTPMAEGASCYVPGGSGLCTAGDCVTAEVNVTVKLLGHEPPPQVSAEITCDYFLSIWTSMELEDFGGGFWGSSLPLVVPPLDCNLKIFGGNGNWLACLITSVPIQPSPLVPTNVIVPLDCTHQLWHLR
ncbi:MAG: hypothetical protein JRG70_18915 [Deltaproteobacteria bacterium]|nr:hypothetical protein [Deltaproteobacteria bacterium]